MSETKIDAERDKAEERKKFVFLFLVAFLLLIIVAPGLGESPYNHF